MDSLIKEVFVLKKNYVPFYLKSNKLRNISKSLPYRPLLRWSLITASPFYTGPNSTAPKI